MRKTTVMPWACPHDGHAPLELTVIEESHNEIIAGTFQCPQCDLVFPIHDGLPNFLYLEREHTAQIKLAEMQARDRDMDTPESLIDRYESEVETEAVLKRLHLDARDRVLDVGCGDGRITRRVLAANVDTIAVDFSPARLMSLRHQLHDINSIDLAVADMNHLPLVPNSFTKILCTQVLEHLPTGALRRAFIHRLLDLLMPGGTLVLTVYNYDATRQRFGESREGFHDSGIFYHCYDAAELRAEMNSNCLSEICGICHHLRGTYKLKLLPRLGTLGRWFDHTLEKLPAISLRYGSLLLAQVTRCD